MMSIIRINYPDARGFIWVERCSVESDTDQCPPIEIDDYWCVECIDKLLFLGLNVR